MKRKVFIMGIIFVLVALMIPTIALAEDAVQTTSIIFGGRLQSDMLFYMQGGVMIDDFDAMACLGLNDSIWIGVHKYPYRTEALSVFTGVELHVSYADEGKIMLTPALPLGFAVNTDAMVIVIESLILPAPDGEAIDVTFAISFLFRL